MIRTLQRLLILATLLPTLGFAMPVVELIRDEVQLTATSKLPIVGGGTTQQIASYTGPVLPDYRKVSAELAAEEDEAGGDQVLSSAYVDIDIFDTGPVVGFSIYAKSELIFDPYLAQSPIYHWDTAFDVSERSEGAVRWVFTVSEDTSVQMVFVNKGTDGFASAKLFDRTTSVLLVDHEVTGFTFGESLVGIAIQAGHKYVLEAKVGEFSGDDDDEASFDFYFEEAVEFVTEP